MTSGGNRRFRCRIRKIKKEFAEKYKNDESTSNEPPSTIQEHKKSGSLEKGGLFPYQKLDQKNLTIRSDSK